MASFRNRDLRGKVEWLYKNRRVGGTGDGSWGSISGDINDQTDLITILNTLTGSQPVENEYADIAALLADQGNQTETFFQYVVDASADPNVASGDAYYEKLATSSGNLNNDYRLLSDTETITITDSNGYQVFRVQYVQNDAAPNNTANGGRIGFNYNTGTNKITSVVFNNQYSDVLTRYYEDRASNSYVLRFYNRTSGQFMYAKVTGWTQNGNYYIVDVEGTIDESEVNNNNRVELFFDIDNSGSGNTLEVNQIGHGLSVGEAVKFDGVNYILAQADDEANADTIGVVIEVTDVDNFIFQYSGILTVGSWIDGTHYFLDPSTAGSIIAEPTYNVGEIRQYIGQGIPEGLLLNLSIGEEIVDNNDVIEEDTNVTISKNIDFSLDTFVYTMTGDTDFAPINLPTSGKSKPITVHLKGNFSPSFFTGFTVYQDTAYDGAADLNIVVIEYVSSVSPYFVINITQYSVV